MSDFWNIFKKTAYFRISWHIQDVFLDTYNKMKFSDEEAQRRRSLRKNARKINKALYDNPFNKRRKKK